MLALVKKLHMYIGLLNFSNLIVFGIAGLAATFQGEGGMAAGATRYESFTRPPGTTDRQIADLVFDHQALCFGDSCLSFCGRDGHNAVSHFLELANRRRRFALLQSFQLAAVGMN